MNVRTLHCKRALHTALLFLLLGVAGMAKLQAQTDNIIFADANVKAICVDNWDTNGDGELNYAEAATVTDLDYEFYHGDQITSFDELQYFISLTSIGEAAFADCWNLSSIVIPNSVTSIDGYAFSNCWNLSSIEIPNSVTSIGDFAFRGCTGLTSMMVASGNTYYDSRDDCNAIIETASNTLVAGCKNTVIPNSVTSIGDQAFEGCTNLTSVEIPNSVTSIGSQAFEGCTGLTSVEIPNSVTSIGYAAFQGCGLTSVEIPNSVTSIGPQAFLGCSGLTTVTIPSSVTYVGYYAFSSCGNMTTATMLAETPPEWDYDIFDGANMSLFVYVPCESEEAYTSIGWGGARNIFGLCDGTLTVEAMPAECGTVSGGGSYAAGTECTITATANDGYAFSYWTLNGNVVSTEAEFTFQLAGDMAFVAHFFQAGIIVFADENVKAICVDNWDFDSDGELSYAEAAAVTDLGDWLGECPFLDTNIGTFDELQYFIGLTSIGEGAFAECDNLSSIEIPNSVTSIGGFAFSNCWNLSSIEIPNSVTSIGNRAFADCSNLSSIEIPNSVISIGDGAFSYCNGLSSMTLLATIPPAIGDMVFENVNSAIPVYVLCESVEAYTSVNWGGFSNIYGMCGGMVAVSASPTEGGTVTGGGTFEAGQSCTVTATANEGYTFVCWAENGYGYIVSYDAEISFPVTGDRNLVAHFAYSSIITTTAEPSEGGTVEGAGEYEYNSTCTVTATANEGYAFMYWTEYDNIVSYDAVYSFIVTGARERDLVAHFALPFTITAIAEPAEGGTVEGTGEYEYNSTCTVTATANEGYAFMYWTENDVEVSTEAIYSFTAIGPRTLVANFIRSTFHFITAGNYSEDINWQNYAMPGVNDTVFIEAPCQLDINTTITMLTVSDGQSLTLLSGNTLTVTGVLANAATTGLVIKDGAQLVNASSNVAATMEKSISAHNGASTGWYTIASPITEMAIAGSGFVTHNYDLYRFNETNLTNEEWENYKANHQDFTHFETGCGYLYANSNSFAPAFKGILNSDGVRIDLTYTERPDDPLSGFNLIGNPFPHNIYKGAGGAINDINLASGFYTLTNEGTWQVHTYEDAILPGQGFLVKVTAPTLLYIDKNNQAASSEADGNNREMSSLCINVAGDSGRDRAYVYFNQGTGLDKIKSIATDAPSLAVRNGNGDFAIAYCDKKSDAVELVFTTPMDGSFTLTVDVAGADFKYLHLIDQLTGDDIDLLALRQAQEPTNYTFEAKTTDKANRFKLVFEVK